jgi:hypothetical protein
MNITFNTDSMFRIGDTHKVCQDYALHGKDYIVVSDGCSSSKNTDLGARLLCLSAKAYLISEFQKNQMTASDFGSRVINSAKKMMDALFLEEQCLDATLLYAYVRGEDIIVGAFGDGNILIEYKTGHVDVININFESGAPYYLSYQLNKERDEKYPIAFPGIMKVSPFALKYNDVISLSYHISDIKSVTLISDGYESFIKDKTKKYEIDVKEVIGFKNIKGDFLQRRVDKYLLQLKKQGIEHYDDLGLASMVFSESE